MSDKLSDDDAITILSAAHPAVIAIVAQIDELDAVVRQAQRSGHTASNEHMIANALRGTLQRVCAAVSEDATMIMVAMVHRKR